MNEPATAEPTIVSERLVETLAYNLYLSTLVGDPAPRIKQLGDRISRPVVGDMVLEVSTIHDETRVGTRLGRLVREALEPMYTPEGWYAEGNAGPDEPIPRERVQYIELSDGREYRWHNARFITVPTEITPL